MTNFPISSNEPASKEEFYALAGVEFAFFVLLLNAFRTTAQAATLRFFYLKFQI
jgi:hypothetical protein